MMRKPMTVRDADRLGRAHGYDIAEAVLVECPDITDEEFGDTIAEADDNHRQYSPFEYHAADINAREERREGSADDGWRAYDEGFARGVRVACREYGRGDLV